tara:strand:+ start:296 stop:499 length:204 start_codon:yes stop_codon:yes gene_type:complete
VLPLTPEPPGPVVPETLILTPSLLVDPDTDTEPETLTLSELVEPERLTVAGPPEKLICADAPQVREF